MTTQQPVAPFQPPIPLDPWELIYSVRDTLDRAAHLAPASRETFHRAVSTAYYVLFHALARNNADNIIGAPTNSSMASRGYLNAVSIPITAPENAARCPWQSLPGAAAGPPGAPQC